MGLDKEANHYYNCAMDLLDDVEIEVCYFFLNTVNYYSNTFFKTKKINFIESFKRKNMQQ